MPEKMLLENFVAGAIRRRTQFSSFEPNSVYHEWTWSDPQINGLLENSAIALGALNTCTRLVPHAEPIMRMSMLKEAQTSSRIEGTKTEFDEALLSESQITPSRLADWQEVQNYLHALNWAIKEMKEIPICTRLLCGAHRHLLEGVRGENKLPGEIRRSQNWIGGATPSDAVFVPPGHENVPEMLADLEKFWHDQQIIVPHIIRCAITHYQFETIHPFLDGNGRIGRLLITLYLNFFGLLDKPWLFISPVLERNRGSYYDALTRVRVSNDLSHWCRFMLEAIRQAADESVQRITAVISLRGSLPERLRPLKQRAARGATLMESFFGTPVMDVQGAADTLECAFGTANRLLADLCAIGVLKEISGRNRDRLYMFEPYVALFR